MNATNDNKIERCLFCADYLHILDGEEDDPNAPWGWFAPVGCKGTFEEDFQTEFKCLHCKNQFNADGTITEGSTPAI